MHRDKEDKVCYNNLTVCSNKTVITEGQRWLTAPPKIDDFAKAQKRTLIYKIHPYNKQDTSVTQLYPRSLKVQIGELLVVAFNLQFFRILTTLKTHVAKVRMPRLFSR